MIKVCSKCGIEKDINEFSWRNDTQIYRNECKECIKLYQQRYRQEHKEEKKEYQKQYNQENKEEKRKYMKQYYQEHKEEKIKYMKQYNQEHKEEVNERKRKYKNERLKNDIQFKLLVNLRNRLHKAIKGNYKSGSAVHDLDCSVGFLKQYLENKFYPHPQTRRRNDLG